MAKIYKSKLEEEICEGFNRGGYIGIAIGYAKIAMRDLGYSSEEISDLENEMYVNFDWYDAAEAWKYYLYGEENCVEENDGERI